MIRVLIVHENPLFRVGLRSVLKQHEGMQLVGVVGKIASLEQLLELAAVRRPDVVVFDGAFTGCQPAFSAVEIVAQVHKIGTSILVFAPSTDEEDLFRFMMSGAAAYELPTISGDDLVEKIRRIALGEYLITSEVLRSAPAKPSVQACSLAHCEPEVPVPDRKQGKQPHDPSQVTAREITILQQVMKGRTNKQIARALGLSDQTVKNHMTSILKKFQVRDRTAAVVIALRRELITFDDAKPSDLHLDQEAFAQRVQRYVGSRVAAEQQQGALPYAMAANA